MEQQGEEAACAAGVQQEQISTSGPRSSKWVAGAGACHSRDSTIVTSDQEASSPEDGQSRVPTEEA